MIDLKGNNLPKRQRELNNKVREATEKRVPFEAIKDKHESTDVDKLFKIDLASNYKNTDYVLEVLKSGDTLYISRVLSKCLWIYDDKYSYLINPDYLQQNIFPHMSIKMKKKMLSTLAKRLKTEPRVLKFYDYCNKKKLTDIAVKFLIHASNSLKLIFVRKGCLDTVTNVESDFFKFFVGESFPVLKAYIETCNDSMFIELLLFRLRHLYSVSDVKYLELIEKYLRHDHKIKPGVFGYRISKDIMTKHKDRVLKKPLLYLAVLNRKAIVKYSLVEDVKYFAVALQPKSVSVYWYENYYRSNKYILDIIPKQELFTFLRQIYIEAYPGEEFEMDARFYDYRYYDMLSIEEKEKWALKNIESLREVLGPGQDFKLYEFVNFDTALEGIKRNIMITIDKERRGEMINVLVAAAKTQSDLQNLFQYYYECHVNESSYNKEYFMKAVIFNHNIFEFDEDCWNAFNKILYSMHIYSNSGFFFMTDFRVIVVVYNILHNKEIPELFEDIFYTELNYLYTDKLSKEKSKILYDYLMNVYIEKVKEFEGKSYEGDVKKTIRQFICAVLRLLEIFDKTKHDCPSSIMEYIILDWEEFKKHHLLKEKVEIELLEDYDLVRLLKKDATLLRDQFPILNETMKCKFSFRLNELLRKLKIYFSKDIAKEFLSFFLDVLSDPGNCYLSIYTSIYGIFQLADQEFKVEFMFKYVPVSQKIDHEKIGHTLLYIQEAICRFSCYSRPRVPLSNTLTYMKGDYVHYCLPVFNYYFVNLPEPVATKFIEATLNAPISVQKHGLRLAFKSYTEEDLKNLVMRIWNRTKNVSLRSVLYKNLFDKIVNEDLAVQKELYKTLALLTSEIREEDDKQISSLLSSNQFPICFRGHLLKIAWTAVSKFKENDTNLETQSEILRAIKLHIFIMDRKFVMENIIEPHINKMLHEKKIRPGYKSRAFSESVKIKWALVSNYIVSAESKEAIQEAADLMTNIMNVCVEMWDEVHDCRYTIRLLCNNFISCLKKSSNNFHQNFKGIISIFERILEIILDKLPVHEMYLTIWDLQLIIIIRKICCQFECNELSVLKNIDSEKVCNEFANAVGNLIIEWINKGQFYKSFLSQITELLKDHIGFLTSASRENFDMLCIKICNGLTAFKSTDVYLVALFLLPIDCPRDYFDSCKETLQKIKGMENDEIRTMVYQKYVRNDFKMREYV